MRRALVTGVNGQDGTCLAEAASSVQKPTGLRVPK